MPPRDDDWLQRERERVRKWKAARSAAGRDIGRLPPVADPLRKREAGRSLRLFYREYFPRTFYLPFCADHDKVITTIEGCVWHGGLFAMAMPRGSGKTVMTELASLWSLLYGFHQFVALFGATVEGAQKMLQSIKVELRDNPLLLADFPEVCFPIHCLEGITNRSAGQRYHGQPTFMLSTRRTLVLPTIPGSLASGSIVSVDGIGSENIRGKHVKHPNGETMRPTLAPIDDPQTDRTARSPVSCQRIEDVISGAILGMAGPGKKISAIMPCTVIGEGDVSERMLNRELHPEWNGIKTRTLYSFPTNEPLWQRYEEIRGDSMRAGNHGREATDFYAANRKEMDKGAKVAWKERYRSDELSALQSAMNRYFRDHFAFAAEDQNEPLSRVAATDMRLLTAAEIMQKLNRVPRGEVPSECSILTGMIDVQQDVLYKAVVGFSQDFGGGVVDYGTWPDQNRPYFTLRELRVKISDALPELLSLEAQIYAALEECVRELATREFMRVDGTPMRIGRLLIDAGYQTQTVYKFCRQSEFAGILTPSHGHFIGAKQTPISLWAKQTGQRRGPEWVIRRSATNRAIRHVTFDTNYWKTFLQARLSAGMGDPSSLALPGTNPKDHRMICDHLVSESPIKVEAKGRTVYEWVLPPDDPDNHLLDDLVGCCVAASMEGAELKPDRKEKQPKPDPPPRRRQKVRYLD